jgi:DNA-binding protein Fis
MIEEQCRHRSEADESRLKQLGTALRIRLIYDQLTSLRESLSGLLEEANVLLSQLQNACDATAVSPGEGFSMYDEVRRFEAELIKWALRLTGGHQSRAARMLGINTTTLNAKITRFGLTGAKMRQRGSLPNGSMGDDDSSVFTAGEREAGSRRSCDETE